jgi:hypothetical protein
MKFTRLHKINSVAVNDVFCAVDEESSLPFHEIMEFILPGAVDMSSSVPRESLPACKPVHAGSVVYFHGIRMSIMDIICQYFALCFSENLPTLTTGFRSRPQPVEGGSLPINVALHNIGRLE